VHVSPRTVFFVIISKRSFCAVVDRLRKSSDVYCFLKKKPRRGHGERVAFTAGVHGDTAITRGWPGNSKRHANLRKRDEKNSTDTVRSDTYNVVLSFFFRTINRFMTKPRSNTGPVPRVETAVVLDRPSGRPTNRSRRAFTWRAHGLVSPLLLSFFVSLRGTGSNGGAGACAWCAAVCRAGQNAEERLKDAGVDGRTGRRCPRRQCLYSVRFVRRPPDPSFLIETSDPPALHRIPVVCRTIVSGTLTIGLQNANRKFTRGGSSEGHLIRNVF